MESTLPDTLSVALIIAQSLLVVLGLVLFAAFAVRRRRKIFSSATKPLSSEVGNFGQVLLSWVSAGRSAFVTPTFPSDDTKAVFLLAPVIAVIVSLVAWSVIPVVQGAAIAELNVGILFVFTVILLEAYGIILAAWSSQSQQTFEKSMRSLAQFFPFRIALGFIIIGVLLCVGSLKMDDIVSSQQTGLISQYTGIEGTVFDWHWLSLLPLLALFYIIIITETGEGSTGRLSAFFGPEPDHHQVYSSTPLLLFAIANHSTALLTCALIALLFFGGWLPPFDVAPFNWVPGSVWFLLKVFAVYLSIPALRNAVGPKRRKKSMGWGWKIILPTSIGLVGLTAIATLALSPVAAS